MLIERWMLKIVKMMMMFVVDEVGMFVIVVVVDSNKEWNRLG